MAETLDILKKIIDNEMEMPVNRVFAYNTDVPLPQDGKLFIVLSVIFRNPYSNNVKYKTINNQYSEVQSMGVKEDILISLLSKDKSARERANEVQLALGSTYSVQQQEINKLHIAKIGTANDASFLEATSRLNRFDVRCSVIRSYEKIKAVDFYDKYRVRLKAGLQGGRVITNNFDNI